jgi:hypothetical protein
MGECHGERSGLAVRRDDQRNQVTRGPPGCHRHAGEQDLGEDHREERQPGESPAEAGGGPVDRRHPSMVPRGAAASGFMDSGACQSSS